MKKILYILVPLLLLTALYLAGPKYQVADFDKTLPHIQISGDSLDHYVKHRESQVRNLKNDNEARIIWANDSLKNKTPYALVYLHGFSASQGEGDPIHRDFAKRYGCNLYLSRLADHGIRSDHALLGMTPARLVNSAKEAIAIGKQLGNKVILMSTSTGGTLSLYLAEGDPDIAALILYSPNIRINNPFVGLLTGHWGLQLGRLIAGGKNLVYPVKTPADSIYWDDSYRVEAVIYLQALIDKTMTKDVFSKVTQPVFLGYYYKDEKHQDPVCRVDAMLDMFNELGTPDSLKVKEAFPDAGEHVIASKYKSNDWEGVQKATYKFAENVLGMKPVE